MFYGMFYNINLKMENRVAYQD